MILIDPKPYLPKKDYRVWRDYVLMCLLWNWGGVGFAWPPYASDVNSSFPRLLRGHVATERSSSAGFTVR